MGLGKKLSTLINATLRGGFSRRRKRRKGAPEGAEEQLKAIREALAEVEVKERQVAEQLKSAQAETKAAAERGDHQEEIAQRRMADELAIRLETQSIEATRLTQKLTEIESQLAEKQAQVKDNLATAQEAITQAKAVGEKDDDIESVEAYQENVAPVGDEETTPTDEDDLTARKSRLSG